MWADRTCVSKFHVASVFELPVRCRDSPEAIVSMRSPPEAQTICRRSRNYEHLYSTISTWSTISLQFQLWPLVYNFDFTLLASAHMSQSEGNVSLSRKQCHVTESLFFSLALAEIRDPIRRTMPHLRPWAVPVVQLRTIAERKAGPSPRHRLTCFSNQCAFKHITAHWLCREACP